MIATREELASRMFHKGIWDVNSVELVGDNKQFGHILANGEKICDIFIHNDIQIMDELEKLIHRDVWSIVQETLPND